MDKNVKIVIFLACVIFMILLVLNLPKKSEMGKACFDNHCFQVEVVNTPEGMKKGLMFRNHLEKNRGMLFVFEKEGNYPFWMKNTLIPLDIIWTNQNQEIVFIKENALPCNQAECPLINPNQKAKYVLEVNGGISKNINLKLGYKITLP